MISELPQSNKYSPSHAADPPLLIIPENASRKVVRPPAVLVIMNRMQCVDDFAKAESWQPIASGQAEIKISRELAASGYALRLDFDFKGGGGFVVARKEFTMTLPEAFAFSFQVRGAAPTNKFEFKLADPTGRNVWRWQEDAFAFFAEARALRLKSSQIEFAWGPAGGGSIRKLGAIEFVISAGPGGKGTLWLEAFQFENRTIRHAPRLTASSQTASSRPKNLLSNQAVGWRSAPSDKQPVLEIDFHQSREYGGLKIEWFPKPAQRSFIVQASEDRVKWRLLRKVTLAEGSCSWVHLPGGESRFLRLVFASPAAIQRIQVLPFDSARTVTDFFHTLAAGSPRGWYPRWLMREQSYWTCAGVPNGLTCGLINEEGLVEPDKGSFVLEPFLQANGKLHTWADAKRSVSLEPGGLPIPSAHWRLPECRMTTTAFATGENANAVLLVRYRIANTSLRPLKTRLHVALRPFQVTPPWQAWNGMGGVKEIHEIAWTGGIVRVNRDKAVIPLSKPTRFGATSFDQGSIIEHLNSGTLPEGHRVKDPFGFASAALQFDVSLPAHGTKDVFLAVPFAAWDQLNRANLNRIAKWEGASLFNEAVEVLTERVSRVGFQLPAGLPQEAVNTFRTAAGQILINRDGPAIQPGPRRYTRSWIRDGVIMGAAMMRIGDQQTLPEFIRWFAPFQRKDGFVPCCVNRNGPDWLVEHDSHGQLIYGVMESFRFTHDRVFLKKLWPSVRQAADFMASLVASRLTPEYNKPDKKTCRGLLPESASHEGYLAHPVHSYWDGFWALRGFRDAAAVAIELGHSDEAKRYAKHAQTLQRHLTESLRRVIQTKDLPYVPGSVEWADFDPTATSNAIALLQGLDCMPPEQVESMFGTYVQDFRRKHRGDMPWNNYTAYEIRIIGALLRLGKRAEALELLAFFLSDRRPLRWNQWPEISWKDPRSPGHLGDVPHTWIASEYMLVFVSLFAFERESDDSIVIGAGVDDAWLKAKNGIAIQGLPTIHGALDLRMIREAQGALKVKLGGDLKRPQGGFVIRPPDHRNIKALHVNGLAKDTFQGTEAIIHEWPAEVLITFV